MAGKFEKWGEVSPLACPWFWVRTMWKVQVGDQEQGLKDNTPTFSILFGSNLVFNPLFLALLSWDVCSFV